MSYEFIFENVEQYQSSISSVGNITIQKFNLQIVEFRILSVIVILVLKY